MIVKIMSNGKSFSGLATYLTHDPDQAKTAERVAWTQTHNLANDDVPCAVNEMLWTARDAELLKQEAGVRAGGRSTESPVKHISLNWAPGEHPTREHMIETSQHFLEHMKWQEHQAVFVAHQDRAHSHVHCILNMVHPETGLRLDDNFERRRAQEWALTYEREHGLYCEQRLLNPAEREKAMPRNMWMAFQQNEKEFTRTEKSLENNAPIYLENPENRENAEWRILKEFQRTERMEFFAAGKLEFKELRNSIYRDVSQEFRERWSDYYAAKKDGASPDDLAPLKEKLVAEQKTVLESRRDEACKELRASRDARYRELLDGQRDARAELRWRLELGLDNADFLNGLGHRSAEKDLAGHFRAAAEEVGRPRDTAREGFASGATPSEGERAPTLAARDEGSHLGDRLGSGVGAFVDSLFSDLINLGSAAPQRSRPPDRDPLAVAAEEATKQRLQHERDEYDAEWRRRQRSPHGD